jgi:hypothetical protein
MSMHLRLAIAVVVFAAIAALLVATFDLGTLAAGGLVLVGSVLAMWVATPPEISGLPPLPWHRRASHD